MGFTMAEKKKIRMEYAKRYRKAKKAEKTRILDEYLKLLGGGNRKYAIHSLNREGKKQLRFINGKKFNLVISSATRKKRVYIKYYDEKVAQAIIKLWKCFRYICGERLVPLLRANLDVISRKKRFGISTEVKEKLATISRSTVERLLTEERKKYKLKGKSTTKKGTLLKNQIPVRRFWAWDEKQPGFCEIDTVSHDGGGEINSHYAWTLTVTDVALCWTEARALKNKAQKWTMEAADDIFQAFPVPIKGFDSDSGAEFINLYFKKYCEERKINFTRGRARHSNDNCFVEQKNGDVIRKTVEYFRYEGDEAVTALQKVYSYLNPLINYFYPTKKTIDKKILPNGKVKKIFEKQLKTPYERVLEHPDVSEKDKLRVKKIKKTLDIVTLQDNLEKACEELYNIANKKGVVPSKGQRNG
ncbi:MAG: transposase [Treponema sp.]|nr:transposase [Treponema sp.]